MDRCVLYTCTHLAVGARACVTDLRHTCVRRFNAYTRARAHTHTQGNHTDVVEVLTRAGGTNGLKDTSEKEFGDKMCKAASRGDLQSLRSLVAKGATVQIPFFLPLSLPPLYNLSRPLPGRVLAKVCGVWCVRHRHRWREKGDARER